MNRRIRIGMVGGGPGSFIGSVHRRAANLDGLYELVSGCFSRDPGKNAAAGRELILPPERLYATWQEMFEAEKNRPDRIPRHQRTRKNTLGACFGACNSEKGRVYYLQC